MAYKISQTSPSALSTEELLAEIHSFKALAVEVVARYSLILDELKRRRQFHAFMRHPVLSFFREIAADELAPEAALALGNRDLIKAILPLPRDRQIEIANGAAIPVAVRTDAGDIRSDDVPIMRMDAPTLKRAFGPSGIRTVHDQAEMIREEGKIERIGMVTVLRDLHAIKIGNQTIKPEEIIPALRALGYSVEMTRGGVAKAC